MVNPCQCVQRMPSQLYKAWEFLDGYKQALNCEIPKNRFGEISYFIFKMRDFLIGASQGNHGVVSLQNRGQYWLLLKDENNSPYKLNNEDFNVYVRPALPHLKEQYTCGWHETGESVIMVVKQFFYSS